MTIKPAFRQFSVCTTGFSDVLLKGILFLGIGILSSALILIQAGSWQVAIYLALTIWAFCRLYYFMFYVIEHYVDGRFKFAGIFSFLRYLLTTQKRD